MNDIVIQAIGFVAIAMNLIAVQFNKYHKIILFKTLGSGLFVLQYFMFAFFKDDATAYIGMFMDGVGIFRNIIFSNNIRNNRPNKNAVIVFSILTFLFGLYSIIFAWNETVNKITFTDNQVLITLIIIFISILAVVAKLISTISYSIKNPHTIRILNIPTSICWIVYNLMVFSIAGVISDSMTLVSVIIAEIRFRKTGEEESKTLPEKTTD